MDNFSTDGTRELLQNLDLPGAQVIFHPHNLGKGTSVRTAIAHCTGDYAIIQDADLEYDPAEYPLFLERVANEHPAAIFGSRTLGGRMVTKYVANYLGVRFLTGLTNLLYGARLTDVATAAKMVRGDVLKSLNLVESGFDLDFELTDKILRAGYEIVEIPMIFKGVRAKERKARSIELLDAVGLAGRAHHKPSELSGGEMQRVAIARSLANNPSLIRADEPTGNLDTKSGDEILAIFENLWKQGHTLVVITHNPHISSRAQKVINLK